MNAISIQKLNFTFGGEFAIRDLSLEIPAGSFVGLVGPNGSGKTTLLKLISGILQPTAGTVTIGGRALAQFVPKELARLLALVGTEEDFERGFTVHDAVAMGRYPFMHTLRGLAAKDHQCIEQAIEQTQIAHLRARPLHDLSSGEQQRVLLARALAQTPGILLLDEPNAHLDFRHVMEFFAVLKDLHERLGLTILAVIHDLNAAACYCPTMALLAEGRLRAYGKPSEIMTATQLEEAFGVRFNLFHPEAELPQIAYRKSRP